jgi:dipeptidyl aminopeptidase/acylaminoacyl peptidase
MHFEAREDPELLIMGPYTLYRTESQKPHDYSFDDGMQPLRAGEVNSWIVKRQTANDAPNYFFTKDFKSYLELSNLQPQTGYNWLTTQLVNWKQLDGTPSQGILYKPENFDPYKKYPVIFNYYEKLSHSLYEFPIPEFTESNINIPWFVSQGYLVFTPDIHYTIGKTGQSVYNTVVSAAQYLSKLPYVDGKKMAIQGHSFGGFETNYLVTHSHLFAAAAEVAGTSDFISSYGTGKQYIAEFGQGRMGATPWQRPDIYIDNTPIFKADEVTTPLLIMHNKADFVVLWAQGIEFFLALHRLEKKVWMLQYDNGNHAVSGKEAEDYTIRVNQFFDYYLKGTPPPKWMTVGVPARLKGIETGLELDTSGRQP